MIWLVAGLSAAVLVLAVVVMQLRRAMQQLERAPANPAEPPPVVSPGPEGATPSGVLTWMRHEIRTPINAIVGMSDLLLDGELTLKQREYLGMLRASAESLSRTFDDILDLCRMDVGRVTLENQPLDLRDAIEVSLDRVASLAAERGLDLSYRMAEGTPPTIHGDLIRLRQILTTLLTNAVRRTHAGEVTVSVAAESNPDGLHEITFTVRDTGMAIPMERASRLFQPLGRIVASADRVADAQDLGLAVCHGLGQLMGGGLAFRNEAGGGSTFELTIVAETPARRLEASVARRADNAVLAVPPMRILLAEDSAVGRTVAVGVLEGLGHAVDVVADGVQVLEALEHKPYDVILMDMHMPTMDGLTATRLVCERWSRDRRPRIIALSASDLPEDRARWLAAGADGWVGKSLPIDDLRRVLAGSAAARPGPARLPSQHTPPDGVPSARREPNDAPAHILEVFLRDAEGQVSALRDAVARKDAGGVERVAHTLKGSAAMVGAASVAGSCGDLIHCVRQGKLDDAAGILEALQAHVAAIGRTLVPPPVHAGRPRASEATE